MDLHLCLPYLAKTGMGREQQSDEGERLLVAGARVWLAVSVVDDSRADVALDLQDSCGVRGASPLSHYAHILQNVFQLRSTGHARGGSVDPARPPSARTPPGEGRGQSMRCAVRGSMDKDARVPRAQGDCSG